MMTKRILVWALCLCLAGTMLCSCGDNGSGSSEGSSSSASAGESKAAEDKSGEDDKSGSDEGDETDGPEDSEGSVAIALNGDSAEVSGNGAQVDGSTVTITAAGKYELTGSLTDGSVVVAADKEDKVELYLNGVDISSSSSAPIRIESAEGCVIHLMEGTASTLTDTAANEHSACLSSKDDLTIKGKGSLTVTGNAKHGIKSSNDVKIKNGDITVTAVKAAVYGEDSVQITGGTLTVKSCTDGIKATNTEEADKGFVSIEEADVTVESASGNGIEAVKSVTITSGSVKIHSDKQAVNCDTQDIAEGCLTAE